MKLDYKKIIITLLIVIVLGVIVYFIWGGITGPEALPTESSSSTPPGDGSSLPPVGTSTGGDSQGNTITFPAESDPLFRVSDQPVSGYWIDPQTDGIFYLDAGGRVLLVNKNEGGDDTEIIKQGVGVLNTLEVGPNSQKVLAAFGDPRSPQWGIFDDVDQTWRPLPSTILNATWGSDNGTLYGVVQNGSVPALALIDTSKGDISIKTLIKDFRFHDAQLSYLFPSTLLVQEKGSSFYPSRVWKIDTKDLSIHQIFGQTNGLSLKPDGEGDVFFSFYKNVFQILNPQTLSAYTPIPFLTLPEKCTLGGAIAYCFVPKSENFKTSVLPDDYLKQKIFTLDAFFEVNLLNGGIVSTDLPKTVNNGLFDATLPKFSKGFLYFINRYDGFLYALNLTSDQFSEAGQNVGD